MTFDQFALLQLYKWEKSTGAKTREQKCQLLH